MATDNTSVNPNENLTENPGAGYNTFEPPPYTGPGENQPHLDQYYAAPPSYPHAAGGHHHHTTIVAVVRQPVVRGVIIQAKPNNYMAFSLINFLFCCACFGIFAIAYSLKVDSEYAAGRTLEAIAASQTAKRLNILGVIFGVTINTMVVIAIIVAVIAANDSDDNSDYYYN